MRWRMEPQILRLINSNEDKFLLIIQPPKAHAEEDVARAETKAYRRTESHTHGSIFQPLLARQR